MPVHDTMEPGERAFYNMATFLLYSDSPAYQWKFTEPYRDWKRPAAPPEKEQA